MGDCESCRFWIPDDRDEAGEGKCHRNAPSPLFLGLASDLIKAITGEDEASRTDEILRQSAYWPITSADEGCGEHQPKAEPA